MKTRSHQRRLITIPMSHYCEKARWGLERLGLEYHEERHLQVMHYPRTWWVSRGPNVPVLVDGRRVIVDSTRILQYLDRFAGHGNRLYPRDPELRSEVERLEELFDEVVGVESRRWVYYHYRNHPVASLRVAGVGVPPHEKFLLPLIYPLFRHIIQRLVEPTRERVETGLDRIRQVLEQTDRQLSAGGPFLLGEDFTAADLTLACMLAPLVLPPNYGIPLPAVEALPDAAQPVAREFRASLTGRYVLRLFESRRRRPGAGSAASRTEAPGSQSARTG